MPGSQYWYSSSYSSNNQPQKDRQAGFILDKVTMKKWQCDRQLHEGELSLQLRLYWQNDVTSQRVLLGLLQSFRWTLPGVIILWGEGERKWKLWEILWYRALEVLEVNANVPTSLHSWICILLCCRMLSAPSARSGTWCSSTRTQPLSPYPGSPSYAYTCTKQSFKLQKPSSEGQCW